MKQLNGTIGTSLLDRGWTKTGQGEENILWCAESWERLFLLEQFARMNDPGNGFFQSN